MFIEWLHKLKSTIHISFEVGILLKGLNGLFELIGGTLLLFFSPEKISDFLQLLTYGELTEDPQDLVANYLSHIANTLSLDSKIFAAMFLISHGVIKIFLIVALLKKKQWAYPTAIGVFILFVIYQLYRFILYNSTTMLLLLILDLFVILLTWLEYKEIQIANKVEIVNYKS